MERFITIIDMLGTVAFAASGALCGLRKRMDIFGVCILGLTTAVGGGIIRDIILGLHPPKAFCDPTAALLALLVSVVFFQKKLRDIITRDQRLYQILMFWMDALGLGAFSVMGVQVAVETVEEPTYFMVVFVGVLTGVGGGVLRDLLSQEVPFIFVKHIYASASLIGALICALLWYKIGSVGAMISGGVAVVLIRFLAARYRWNLPRAEL